MKNDEIDANRREKVKTYEDEEMDKRVGELRDGGE